jgi:hypothetical protein
LTIRIPNSPYLLVGVTHDLANPTNRWSSPINLGFCVIRLRISINVSDLKRQGRSVDGLHSRCQIEIKLMLFPESVEDYVTEDNPVRFIDAFVASLDLAELGFAHATIGDWEAARGSSSFVN